MCLQCLLGYVCMWVCVYARNCVCVYYLFICLVVYLLVCWYVYTFMFEFQLMCCV